jgi:hypothetical protein
MAVITADTFNPLKQFVAVRLQQGVPLVDADWNELDDVRKFEVRAFLKWFMGDGVPAGSDGFRIEGTALPNNFVVRAGVVGPADALNNVGRILADGRDAIITADFTFTSQALHVSQPGSAALATALGVPQIQPLTTPVANTNVVAYLDIWERLVTPVEDPTLVLPGIGAESCARLKRERVVRVRAGTAAPVSGNPDFLAGHSYLALATIARFTGQDAVNAANVTDRRRTGLTVASMDARMEILERLTLRPAFLPVPNQFFPKVGAAGVQNITLQGRNFLVGTSPPVVQIGGVGGTIVGAPTPTQIVVTVPLATPLGNQNVRVTTQGGTVLSDEQFNVLAAPVPSFLAPPNQFTPKVGANNVQMVTLNGANFNIPGLAVSFAGVPAFVQSNTAVQIVCRVPAMAPGIVNITVATNAGTVVSAETFTVL